MDQQEQLKRHLIDLSRQAEGRNMYTFSNFLSLPEQDLFTQARPEFAPVSASLYGGSPEAERQIAVFGSEADFGYQAEYPVAVMAVTPNAPKYAEELTHRDYLGAIMNLGIERELIGDIIIKGKNAWFYCMDSIADYLASSLIQVRHDSVTCTRVLSDIPELAPTFRELSLNVASERLDAVVAAFCNIARGKAQELFRQQKVMVNGRLLPEGSKPLKEGDILSVRGFGKAIYEGISHETRKGRCYVLLKKYD